MMSIHIVLNYAIRKSFKDFVALKEYKDKMTRRLLASFCVIMVVRASMKKRGGTFIERERRKTKHALTFGHLSLIDNC